MKLILLVEIFILITSYVGSSFVGIMNRQDKLLKRFRVYLFMILIISFNLIVFLGY